MEINGKRIDHNLNNMQRERALDGKKRKLKGAVLWSDPPKHTTPSSYKTLDLLGRLHVGST